MKEQRIIGTERNSFRNKLDAIICLPQAANFDSSITAVLDIMLILGGAA
jgi:hypothetical protein